MRFVRIFERGEGELVEQLAGVKTTFPGETDYAIALMGPEGPVGFLVCPDEAGRDEMFDDLTADQVFSVVEEGKSISGLVRAIVEKENSDVH